jgi:hypothetical protein
VRVETADGQLIRDYDLPWSVERLQALNFLPIHAVLFRRSVVLELGLQFREDLPVLEDWDFWRRLAQAGAFIHVSGVSARYRKLDLGSGVSHDGENDWKVWQQKLLVEWTAHASPEEQARLLAWHARALDAQEQSAYALHQSLDAIQRERLELLARLERHEEFTLQEIRRREIEWNHHAQMLSERHESLRRGFEQQIQEALSDRDRVSRSYESQIRELMTENARLHQSYGHQLQAALASRDELSVAFQEQIAALDEDRSRLRAGFEEQIRALLADRDASIQKYEQTLSALRFDRDALHQKLGRIVNSRLWRLTAPLREILRWLTHRS